MLNRLLSLVIAVNKRDRYIIAKLGLKQNLFFVEIVYYRFFNYLHKANACGFSGEKI